MKQNIGHWTDIFASAPNAILVTDPHANIMYVNPAWEKLTGYTLAEVKGKNPKILQSGKTPKHVYKNLWKALINGEPFVSEAVIDKRKDGSLYQIQATFYPVQKDKKTIYYVQIQQDITERIRIEDLKSEFFSILSHELKTPITVLKLLIQSKFQKKKELQLTPEEMHFFEEELDRLTDLINDMLDTSRIERNKMRLQFEVLNITELLRTMIEKLRMVAQNHRLILDTANPYMGIADKKRIEQVVINLLTNAIKYSPEKTTITISITKHKLHTIVSVKDQGIGIPQKDQSAIFEKFHQASKKSGFGLGLYISKEIIKLHKGKIWVDSEEGKGSTFFFSLPSID